MNSFVSRCRLREVCALVILLLPAVVFGKPPGSAAGAVYSAGAAKIDVTPQGPIRLTGYLARTNETAETEQRLFARALAIGKDKSPPALLLCVDNCGVPDSVRAEVLRRLSKYGLTGERFALCSTHTHCGPMLAGALPNIFGKDPTGEQLERVRRYTSELVDKLEKVSVEALGHRRPARLYWGKGQAGFGQNRRTKGGPSDPDVPVLKVTDVPGRQVLALFSSYACHCTTLGSDLNKFCGDWAGYAAEYLETEHPGATVLIGIGCGGDQNPQPRPGLALAKQHGRTLADAIQAVLTANPAPLHGDLVCRTKHVSLPLEPLPTREKWESLSRNDDSKGYPLAYHAKKYLARLDRGETLPTSVPYLVQTWHFGGQLGMVFLPGEVVVDYSLRLKKEFDFSRLWVNAYANDVPCYIPSKRIVQEGGYEGGGAMIYYDWPAKLTLETEDIIIGAVHDLMPPDFQPTPTR